MKGNERFQQHLALLNGHPGEPDTVGALHICVVHPEQLLQGALGYIHAVSRPVDPAPGSDNFSLLKIKKQGL